MIESYPMLRGRFQRPAVDQVYQADYLHGDGDCSNCLQSALIDRASRDIEQPVVHYGTIGSANQVVRDAFLRDRLYREESILCFEMEAAGLMDIGCLVIRGICGKSAKPFQVLNVL